MACIVVVVGAAQCLVVMNSGESAGLILSVPTTDSALSVTVAWVSTRRLQTTSVPTGTTPLVISPDSVPMLLTLIEAEAHSDFMSADEATAGLAQQTAEPLAGSIALIASKLDSLVTAGSAMERRMTLLEKPVAGGATATDTRRRKGKKKLAPDSGADSSGLWGRQVSSPHDDEEESEDEDIGGPATLT